MLSSAHAGILASFSPAWPSSITDIDRRAIERPCKLAMPASASISIERALDVTRCQPVNTDQRYALVFLAVLKMLRKFDRTAARLALNDHDRALSPTPCGSPECRPRCAAIRQGPASSPVVLNARASWLWLVPILPSSASIFVNTGIIRWRDMPRARAGVAAERLAHERAIAQSRRCRSGQHHFRQARRRTPGRHEYAVRIGNARPAPPRCRSVFAAVAGCDWSGR